MSTNLAENSIFAQRYRVVRCLAAGGMGAVYEVIHLETERKRALKVMHAQLVSSADLRERFKGEARVAAKIDSDYIVDVFDAGIDEASQMPFLVMELLKGEELGKRLERLGKFSPTEALSYLWQTALALDKTHKANIVHRDLKPENLFLNQRDDGPPRVKVLDFGVAKFVADAGTQVNVTRSVGTPLYMAPEQFLGQNITTSCDVYALAMMAYTMLVGEAYWAPEAEHAATVFAFATSVQRGPIEPPSSRAARRGVAFTRDFDTWFQRATSATIAERYPSATATIAALGEVFGMNPARLVGVAASDPHGVVAQQRPSGAEWPAAQAPTAARSGPGISSPGASGALGPGTNVGGVVTPARPKSSAGAFVGIALGVVVVGVVAFIALRGRGSSESAGAAAPAKDVVAEHASAAPSAAPAPTASAAPSVAPASAPTPEASATASTEPSATAAAAATPVAAARGGARPGAGKPAKAPPPQAAPPVAATPPPPAPATKQPTYTRD